MFRANRNHKPSVAQRDELFLQLGGVCRTSKNGFELVCEPSAGRIDCAPDSTELRAVVLVDFAVLNRAAEMLAQVAQVGKAVPGLRQLRECFALLFPSNAESFCVGKERLDR